VRVIRAGEGNFRVKQQRLPSACSSRDKFLSSQTLPYSTRCSRYPIPLKYMRFLEPRESQQRAEDIEQARRQRTSRRRLTSNREDGSEGPDEDSKTEDKDTATLAASRAIKPVG
jgi:hypothetical protein